MSRRRPGEEFEYYVEQSFIRLGNILIKNHININERLDKMTTLAEELGVEEHTLSEVIPALATELTDLQTKLTEKEGALATAATELAQDSAELTANRAELAAIQQVKENLAPLVEKAKNLVPAPVVTPPAETPPSETPPTEQPPAETPPVEGEQPAPETPAEPAPEVPPTPEG